MNKKKIIIINIVFLLTSCRTIQSLDDISNNYGIFLSPDRNEPHFVNEIDKKYYHVLAGLYVDPANDYTIDSIYRFRKGEFSWGHDYSLGKYSTCIDYSDSGEWEIIEDGCVDYFKIIAGDNKSVTIDYGDNYTPRIVKIAFSDHCYIINGYQYVKIAGPDRPMSLLTRIINRKAIDLEYLKSVSPILTIGENELMDRCDLIRYALLNSDYEKLTSFYSSEYGIRFGLDGKSIRIADTTGNNEEYKRNIDMEAFTLRYWSTGSFDVYINKYKYISAREIYKRIKNPITVEYYAGIYDYYVMVFANENGQIKLAAIIDKIDIE